MDFKQAISESVDKGGLREALLGLEISDEAMVGNFGPMASFAFNSGNHARDCLVTAADEAWDGLDVEHGEQGLKESLRGGVVIDRRALLALLLFATKQAEQAVGALVWKDAVAMVLASDEDLLVKFMVASMKLAGESGQSLGEELFGGL